MSTLAARVERVQSFLVAAQKLVDPEQPLGAMARRELPASTGLSLAGVAYALEHCFERCPDVTRLRSLCVAHSEAPEVHVLLSANVFVAPLRAIALGLASSARVSVRPSRREPVMTELLHDAAPGSFRIVSELAPKDGDHVWAYGSDPALQSVRSQLPSRVLFRPHGPGIGAALLDEEGCSNRHSAARLAEDIIAFDQRGCLSPRFAVVAAPPAVGFRLAEDLERELASWHQRVPRGRLSDTELADLTRFSRAMTYAADYAWSSDAGAVALVVDRERWILPPVGRALLIVCTEEPLELLAAHGSELTQVGVACSRVLTEKIAARLPGARITPLGRMQRPEFDGPVDRRIRDVVGIH